MLKTGQRRKGEPMRIAALGVEEYAHHTTPTTVERYPAAFVVAAAFADNLRPDDIVVFTPHRSESSPLWSKTWRVVRVEGERFTGGNDTCKVYVVER